MPDRPLRPCRRVGCSALTRSASGYCDAHAGDVEAKRQARQADYDRRRGSASARGYGARWRAIRAAVLRDEPLCRACAAAGRTTPATDVDHIVARARGGTDERGNHQPLGHSCHSSKTAREDGGCAWVGG